MHYRSPFSIVFCQRLPGRVVSWPKRWGTSPILRRRFGGKMLGFEGHNPTGWGKPVMFLWVYKLGVSTINNGYS